jgi:hypothetical protein
VHGSESRPRLERNSVNRRLEREDVAEKKAKTQEASFLPATRAFDRPNSSVGRRMACPLWTLAYEDRRFGSRDISRVVAKDAALKQGHRGLPGGDTLARLLERERGRRNPTRPPALTLKQVLAWADSHHRRTGRWPNRNSGTVMDAPDETWLAIYAALHHGGRGLPGGNSLPGLLAKHRGARYWRLPSLTVDQILTWADRHHRRTGKWPRNTSGSIADAPGEIWMSVDRALRDGRRGLSAGTSLAKLLEEKRGVRNKAHLPRHSYAKIRSWACAHRHRTGRWPSRRSGPILEARGELWPTLDIALREGYRGLPGGMTLSRLVASMRRA